MFVSETLDLLEMQRGGVMYRGVAPPLSVFGSSVWAFHVRDNDGVIFLGNVCLSFSRYATQL